MAPLHAIHTFMQNFISASTVRDITSLRHDFFSALIKAVVFGGLCPRIARIALPKATFDQVAAGTVQREHAAKEFKMYIQDQGRVFLHPSSVLFGVASYKSPFLTYFATSTTSKTFLRDATEIPIYALLLFAARFSVDPIRGGITLGNNGWIRLRAWARVGVLVTQLRRLLDAQLDESIEYAQIADLGEQNPVMEAILTLITHDGLSAD